MSSCDWWVSAWAHYKTSSACDWRTAICRVTTSANQMEEHRWTEREYDVCRCDVYMGHSGCSRCFSPCLSITPSLLFAHFHTLMLTQQGCMYVKKKTETTISTTSLCCGRKIINKVSQGKVPESSVLSCF